MLIIANLFVAQIGLAQKTDTIFSTSKGAIGGYDPVAYFTTGQASKGDKQITYTWKGADWHFQDTLNRALFVQNPEKYAPQYGGYCAYGWSKGYAAKIDPTAWAIVDEKLYLNYNHDVQTIWNKDRTALIQKADEAYQQKSVSKSGN